MLAYILGAIITAISAVIPVVSALIYFAILFWASLKLPREYDTIWEVLTVTFGLIVVSGIIGMLLLPTIPQLVTYLAWIEWTTLPGFIQMLIITLASLTIAEQLKVLRR